MSRSKLDVVTNLAILATCVIASTVLVRREFFPPRPAPPPKTVTAGERFDALRDVVPAGAPKVMVIALAPNCHFCNDSMLFYRELITRRDSSRSAVRVVAAVPSAEARDPEGSTLAASGVKPDALVQLDFESLKVRGTPTVLLIDRQGKILAVWEGLLDARDRDQVLSRL
jgi:thioredoxin-related protein